MPSTPYGISSDLTVPPNQRGTPFFPRSYSELTVRRVISPTERVNNYTFNMDAMTSFEGDTGPYLQYAHARVCSIERKAGLSEEDLASVDLTLLQEVHAQNLVRVLAQWPDVVQNLFKTLEPTTVLAYLFKMTHVLSGSYDHLRVVGREKELMKARMALYDAARIVLSNGMRLLGLTPLERSVISSFRACPPLLLSRYPIKVVFAGLGMCAYRSVFDRM